MVQRKCTFYSNELSRLRMFFNLRLPFDEKKPIVYLIVVTYQFIECVYTLVLCACILSIGIGMYMFLFSVVEDIKRDLRLTNELAKTPRNQCQMVFKELSDVLQLHSDSKQCVFSFTSDLLPKQKISNLKFHILSSDSFTAS